MKKSVWNYVVLSEVILSFALPVHSLSFGIVTLPVLITGALKGVGFAIVHALCTIGGCFGVWAIQEAAKYYLSEWPARRSHWLWPLICADIGVVSLWTEMTGQFTGFDLNWYSVVAAVAPTLCTIHIFVLALRKWRSELGSVRRPNNALQATRENARA